MYTVCYNSTLNLLLKQYSQYNHFFVKNMRYKLIKNASIFLSNALTHIGLGKYFYILLQFKMFDFILRLKYIYFNTYIYTKR
jgi:hypothetical protein